MRIALLGDIALIGRYDRKESKDVDIRVEAIKQITDGCDYVIGNLESPLTSVTHTHVCKGVYLRSDPVNVSTLLQMGVTHVTLANNHIYDYGKKGVAETISTLNTAGIKYVGLNNPPEVLCKDSSRVMLDGFCCLSANAINYGVKRGQVKMLSPKSIELFLKRAHGNRCVPIVSVHFGIEGLHYPSIEHIHLFRNLAKKYDYLLHGNHPHAIQGYEAINKSLLIYAQGNLCFDVTPVTSLHLAPIETDEERKSYISIIEIDENRVTSYEMIPVTDLDTGIIHKNKEILHEIDNYSEVLSYPDNVIDQKRKYEKLNLRTSSQERNLQFYLDRLNYKYIGAFINGIIHRRHYFMIMKDYMS